MPSKVTLKVIQGSLDKDSYVFDDTTTCIIGRATDCSPRIPDNEAHQIISRHHCLLDINPPDIRVRDFGSLNGTFVNGKKIGIAPVYHTVTAKISPNAYKADFAIYNPVRLNIVAYPTDQGQYTQEKDIEINPDNFDTVPARVVFDMSVDPEQPISK